MARLEGYHELGLWLEAPARFAVGRAESCQLEEAAPEPEPDALPLKLSLGDDVHAQVQVESAASPASAPR